MEKNSSVFPAHIRRDDSDGKVMQTVAEHCRNTAVYAGAALKPAGLCRAGYLAGLLHDLGKCRKAFSDYLYAADAGEKVRRGSVNHSYAGAKFILEQYHREGPATFSGLAAELLAYAVGAHHGLFDCVSEDGKDGFEQRAAASDIEYEEALSNFLAACAEKTELDTLFQKAALELERKLQALQGLVRSEDDEEMSFYGGLLARTLLSAVIEGDRRDTAEFMTGRSVPESPQDMQSFWKANLEFLEKKLSLMPEDTAVSHARKRFSEKSASLSKKPVGVYRLCLPTGGGKTLASLRAALSHAAKHGKRRIIFAIPLLSVLDQNAEVLREHLLSKDQILEHHSNLLRENAGEKLDHRELLLDSWSSPIVITTLVQVFNTLFDGRSSCIRRMQALCGSVLVIDEVQSVPPRLLTLFNLAVSYLAAACDTTVILCSATQPCSSAAAHPIVPEPENIVEFSSPLWEPFRRTRISAPVELLQDQIAGYLKAVPARNCLLVCNTKAEAAAVYRQLEGRECYHLSASMCMAHRRETLRAIEAALVEKHHFLCVATQVIECGVDISFAGAARMLAGLDSILQTAGRCNRHGEQTEPAEVSVIRCADEKLPRLPDIQNAKAATEALFEAFSRDPNAFGGDVSSACSVDFFYRKLYGNMKQAAQDGPVDGSLSLYGLLSGNDTFCGKCGTRDHYWLRQAFAAAGQLFQVFDDNSYDILVPYGEGKTIISELRSERAKYDLLYTKELLDKAKNYTVSLFQYQKEALERQGALESIGSVLVLGSPWYDEHTGLLTREPENSFWEA